MFAKKSPAKSTLDEAIDNALERVADDRWDQEKYADAVDQLVKLHKLREDEKPQRVSPETLVMAGANLLGILIIVGHERAHLVTSKALTFLGKTLR